MKYVWLLVLAICLLAALAGCPKPGAGPAGTSAAAPEALVVTVGYFPNVTHAPAVLGFSQKELTFAQALAGKATLKTKTFNAGPSAMEALHAGALDMCFVGPTPAINAFAKGGDVVMVANVANGGSVLVARGGLGIATVKDLEGRKIAVPQIGNPQDALLRHLLKAANLKLTDQGGKTTVLPVENPDILALFQSKQLDAACVPEPWGARLEQEAGAKVVLDEKQMFREGDYPVTVLVVRKDFLAEHKDIVKAFLAALQELTDKLAEDPTSQAGALNAELKVLTNKELKPAVLSAALKRISFTTKISPESLQAMAEMIKEVGIAKTVPELTGFADPSFLPKSAGSKPTGG